MSIQTREGQRAAVFHVDLNLLSDHVRVPKRRAWAYILKQVKAVDKKIQTAIATITRFCKGF